MGDSKQSILFFYIFSPRVIMLNVFLLVWESGFENPWEGRRYMVKYFLAKPQFWKIQGNRILYFLCGQLILTSLPSTTIEGRLTVSDYIDITIMKNLKFYKNILETNDVSRIYSIIKRISS